MTWYKAKKRRENTYLCGTALWQAGVAEKAADAAIQALRELPLESEYRAFYTQRVCGRIQAEALDADTKAQAED